MKKKKNQHRNSQINSAFAKDALCVTLSGVIFTVLFCVIYELMTSVDLLSVNAFTEPISQLEMHCSFTRIRIDGVIVAVYLDVTLLSAVDASLGCVFSRKHTRTQPAQSEEKKANNDNVKM